MKSRNDLTAEYVRSILDYDWKTGIFTWKYRLDRNNQWNARFAREQAGSKFKDGKYSYWKTTIRINNLQYYASRLAFLIMTGRWPKEQMDHINCDSLDNRWTNLREATATENRLNTRARKNGKISLKGVYLNQSKKNPYRAQIRVNGKKTDLGSHPSPEIAHAAYAEAAKKHHGAFAHA